MGRQINFYMTSEDENEFCAFVLSEPGVMIFQDRVLALPPEEFTCPLPLSSDTWEGYISKRVFLIWNKSILLGPRYEWHHCGFYQTAGSQEGGIEFTRSVTSGGILRAGRLWTEHRGSKFYNLDGTVRDPTMKKAYDRWLTRLFGWFRKRYIRQYGVGPYGFYVAPGALRFQEMGGQLGAMHTAMDDPPNMGRIRGHH